MIFEPWMVWIAVGVICMIIEIFTPGFLFMSFGVGAILTGLVALVIPILWLQILTFGIITFVLFINLRKLSKKLIKTVEKTNFEAMEGKVGFVTDKIPADGTGHVKIGGEEWTARELDNGSIKKDEKISVIQVSGNKLVVLRIEKDGSKLD